LFPLAILLLVAVAAALYLPTLQNGFVFDDPPLFVGAEAGDEILPWPRFFTQATHSFYRPLRSLSYRMDRAAWDFNPLGYHLSGLLLHALVGVAFCSLLASAGLSLRTSLLAALLFLAHPANTEAVDYLSSRSEVMGSLFALLFLTTAGRAARRDERPARPLFALAVVFFIAALLSKETFALLALYPLFLPGRGSARKRLIAACGMISVAFILARFLLIPGAMGASRFGVHLSYPQIMIKGPAGLLSYLRLLVFPIGLSPDHPLPILPLPGPVPWAAQASLLAAVLIGIAALGRLSPGGRRGAAWLLLSLVPLANLYPAPRIFAEKYLYFPSLWFCLLLASLLNELCVCCGRGVSPRSLPTRIAAGRRSHAEAPASPCLHEPLPSAAFALFSAVILACFALLTLARHPDWRSDLSLWASAVKKRPASPLALFNRGTSLLQSGVPRHGILFLQEASELLPRHPRVHERMGDAWAMLERPDLARKSYEAALERSPEKGYLQLKLAAVYHRLGEREKADAAFEEALSRPPPSPALYRRLDLSADFLSLSAAFRSRGEPEKARRILRQGLSVFPRNPEILKAAAGDLLREGKAEEAAGLLEKAMEVAGERADLLSLLGECRQSQGCPEKAEEAWRKALALRPADFQSWTNLGNIRQSRGDYRRAEEAYLSSLAVQDSFKARYNLGFLYLKQLGAPEKAIPHLRRARELCSDFSLDPKLAAGIAAAESASGQEN